MKINLLSIISKIFIVLVALAGLYMCILWYPISLGLGSSSAASDDTLYIFQLIFYWFCSLPCFYVLVHFWEISSRFSDKLFFTPTTVNHLKTSAIILMIDVIIFLIGNIIFLLIDNSQLTVLQFYLFLSFCGFIIAAVLILISYFTKKINKLEEEVESYI